jgi:hypothetical protein
MFPNLRTVCSEIRTVFFFSTGGERLQIVACSLPPFKRMRRLVSRLYRDYDAVCPVPMIKTQNSPCHESAMNFGTASIAVSRYFLTTPPLSLPLPLSLHCQHDACSEQHLQANVCFRTSAWNCAKLTHDCIAR